MQYLEHAPTQLMRQALASILGIALFWLSRRFALAEFCARHRVLLAIVCIAALCLLFPLGIDDGTGHRTWLRLPFVGMQIQVAAFVTLGFVLLLARLSARMSD